MMNEVITIENTEMQIREYAGQRVVTFKDIDTVHQRPDGTARNAFKRNKKHLEVGKHYFVLKSDEVKEQNPNVHQTYIRNIVVPNRGITVLTERGYLMLVKAFTDDLSWQVQDRLVEVYFNAREQSLQQITDFPEYPKQIYQTSSTPVPKNPSWYHRNRRRMDRICERANISLSALYHHILVRLGEEYDLDRANDIYEEEVGHAPKYALDIVTYFPELGRLADDYLDRVEKVQSKE